MPKSENSSFPLHLFSPRKGQDMNVSTRSIKQNLQLNTSQGCVRLPHERKTLLFFPSPFLFGNRREKSRLWFYIIPQARLVFS